MGQEFFINSQELESKVRQLLPSQGGAGAGFDLSASTQIVPIIDLTESAEGSNVRADLQTALSLNDITSFSVENTTSTIINNTGYFRLFGTYNFRINTGQCNFSFTDGVTTKIITQFRQDGTSNTSANINSYDFTVFLGAGDSLTATSTAAGAFLFGCTKQIADIDGNLTTPS